MHSTPHREEKSVHTDGKMIRALANQRPDLGPGSEAVRRFRGGSIVPRRTTGPHFCIATETGGGGLGDRGHAVVSSGCAPEGESVSRGKRKPRA